MSGNSRPLPVTIIACLYIVVGAIGFVYHFTDFKAMHPFPYDIFGIEFVRLIAIVCGVGMLRGYNWARWLAISWIALHVVLSAFHEWSQVVIHCLFFAVIAWSLFHAKAARYFRSTRVEPA